MTNTPPPSLWQDRYYESDDGLRLHTRLYCARAANTPLRNSEPAVICLPGLTRNARDFHALAVFLATHPQWARDVHVFEYRGRGLSAYDKKWQNYTPQVEARDVLRGMDAFDLSCADLIGTSRGGIVILLLALVAAPRIRRFVLNDIGPRINRAGLERIRKQLVDTSQPQTWRQAATLLRKQHGAQFPTLDGARWNALARQIYRDENGRPARDFDAQLLRTLDALKPDTPLPELWEPFKLLIKKPGLVIHGAHSDILTPAIIHQMQAIKTDLVVHRVHGEGHAPLLEDSASQAAIGSFLATVAP